jgi:hypothetical protein
MIFSFHSSKTVVHYKLYIFITLKCFLMWCYALSIDTVLQFKVYSLIAFPLLNLYSLVNLIVQYYIGVEFINV